MNYEKALEIVKRVIDDNEKNNVCIFIDGQWGIGKTYTVNKFKEQNKDKYDMKYISVFGKQNVKDIEKEIVMQLSFAYNIINNKASEHPTVKLFGNIVKTIGKGTTGIDFDFSKLIDNIPIEAMESKENIIICIDDLERKSDNISLKDLLGLIERTSRKFKVLLIGSTLNLNESELKILNGFSEKLIDCKLTVNELSENTLYELVNVTLSYFEEDVKTKIIEIFKANKLKNKYMLNNLRIFKQYINLIGKVYNEAIKLLNDKIIFDETIVKICNEVVYENFIIDNERKKSDYNYDKENLKIIIRKIFSYEDYDEEIFKEYFEDYSEIRQDIRKFRNAYKLSRNEAELLFDKIKSKIELQDESYFIKQENIISLYDVLSKMGIVKLVDEGLRKMVKILYKPELGKVPKQIEIEDWNDVDFNGERINYHVISIINYINDYNLNTYNEYMEKSIKESIEGSDLKSIYNVIQYVEIEEFQNFEKIFTLAFDKINEEYDESSWKVLCRLIYHTKSSVIGDYFLKRQNEATGILEIMRLKELDSILDEKNYYELQEEAYRQNEEENL